MIQYLQNIRVHHIIRGKKTQTPLALKYMYNAYRANRANS